MLRHEVNIGRMNMNILNIFSQNFLHFFSEHLSHVLRHPIPSYSILYEFILQSLIFKKFKYIFIYCFEVTFKSHKKGTSNFRFRSKFNINFYYFSIFLLPFILVMKISFKKNITFLIMGLIKKRSNVVIMLINYTLMSFDNENIVFITLKNVIK